MTLATAMGLLSEAVVFCELRSSRDGRLRVRAEWAKASVVAVARRSIPDGDDEARVRAALAEARRLVEAAAA